MTIDLTRPVGAGGVMYTADRSGDGVVDGFSGLDTPIPNGAYILAENVVVKVPPVGGTSYAFGTYNLNGTAINANGIRQTSGADGALVGTQMTADNYVAATISGTYTAGVVTLLVRYFI